MDVDKKAANGGKSLLASGRVKTKVLFQFVLQIKTSSNTIVVSGAATVYEGCGYGGCHVWNPGCAKHVYATSL